MSELPLPLSPIKEHINSNATCYTPDKTKPNNMNGEKDIEEFMLLDPPIGVDIERMDDKNQVGFKLI